MPKPFQFRLLTLIAATAGVAVCCAAIYYRIEGLVLALVFGIIVPIELIRRDSPLVDVVVLAQAVCAIVLSMITRTLAGLESGGSDDPYLQIGISLAWILVVFWLSSTIVAVSCLQRRRSRCLIVALSLNVSVFIFAIIS
jgi:hypothetical protein